MAKKVGHTNNPGLLKNNILLFCLCFLGALNKLKIQHHEDPNITTLVANKPFLLRSLFTVGALARHFDFDLEEFKGTNKVGLQLMSNDIYSSSSGCFLSKLKLRCETKAIALPPLLLI